MRVEAAYGTFSFVLEYLVVYWAGVPGIPFYPELLIPGTPVVGTNSTLR